MPPMDLPNKNANHLHSFDENNESKEDFRESSSSHPSPRASDVDPTLLDRTDDGNEDFIFVADSRRRLSSSFIISNDIVSSIIMHEVSGVKKRLLDIMSNQHAQVHSTSAIDAKDSPQETCTSSDGENSKKRRKSNSESDVREQAIGSSHVGSKDTTEIDQNQPTIQVPNHEDEKSMSSCTNASSLENGEEINESTNDDARFLFCEAQLQREKQKFILHRKAYRMKRMSMMFRMIMCSQQILLNKLQTCMDDKELFN